MLRNSQVSVASVRPASGILETSMHDSPFPYPYIHLVLGLQPARWRSFLTLDPLAHMKLTLPELRLKDALSLLHQTSGAFPSRLLILPHPIVSALTIMYCNDCAAPVQETKLVRLTSTPGSLTGFRAESHRDVVSATVIGRVSQAPKAHGTPRASYPKTRGRDARTPSMASSPLLGVFDFPPFFLASAPCVEAVAHRRLSAGIQGRKELISHPGC